MITVTARFPDLPPGHFWRVRREYVGPDYVVQLRQRRAVGSRMRVQADVASHVVANAGLLRGVMMRLKFDHARLEAAKSRVGDYGGGDE